MTVKELAEEAHWFQKTHGDDLLVAVQDKSLGSLEPLGIKSNTVEYGRRALCLSTDALSQSDLADKLAMGVFDVMQTSQFNNILNQQLEEDFKGSEYLNQLLATLIGVVTSEEFVKLLKEKLKL